LGVTLFKDDAGNASIGPITIIVEWCRGPMTLLVRGWALRRDGPAPALKARTNGDTAAALETKRPEVDRRSLTASARASALKAFDEMRGPGRWTPRLKGVFDPTPG
jgi:hypothetical protein